MEIPKSSQDVLGRWLSRWRNRRVAKEIEPPFLDLACGDNCLKNMIAGGLGVDIMNYASADLIVKDFTHLPIKSDSFNTVAVVASLNYFSDPALVLAECARVLKPGGRLVMTMIRPIIGKIWHSLREPWASSAGFSCRQIDSFMKALPLRLTNKSGFMFGLNQLYVYKKHE